MAEKNKLTDKNKLLMEKVHVPTPSGLEEGWKTVL